MKSAILLLFGICCLSSYAQQVLNPDDFDNSQTLVEDVYDIFWRLDDDTITLGIEFQGMGYVGFGIAEFSSGGMGGADILVIEPSLEDMTVTLTDRWASDKITPVVDEFSSDWELVEATVTDEFVAVVVRRAIENDDCQDRAFMMAPETGTRIIYAYSEDSTELVYHGSNRGATQMFLNGIPPTFDVDGESIVIVGVTDYVVPDGVTNYVCVAQALPFVDSVYMTAFDTVSDPINLGQDAPQLHHILAFGCNLEGSTVLEDFAEPMSCFEGVQIDGCTDLIYGWAVGAEAIILPDNVGFKAGEGGYDGILLQIHYDNPSMGQGAPDNSAIAIQYSSEPREFEAGVMQLGDPFLAQRRAIVSEAPDVDHYEYTCPESCTETWDHPITILSDFLHMHGDGTQIYSTHHSNGEVNEILRIDYWDFAFQNFNPVDNLTISPGDRVNTHCTYRSPGGPVSFGTASEEEMCIEFLLYYPRLFNPSGSAFGFCGYITDQVTICGEEPIFVRQPSVPDNPRGDETFFGFCDLPQLLEETPAPQSSASQLSLLFSIVCLLSIFFQ